MTSLIFLVGCGTVPWAMCRTMRALIEDGAAPDLAYSRRAVFRLQRVTLLTSAAALPASGVAGALLVDPALTTRWPTVGSWFFASLCGATTWVGLALARRGPDEAASMPTLETTGRALQVSAVPALAVALSLLCFAAAQWWLAATPVLGALLAALASVAAVIVVSPWLAMVSGLWRVFPTRIKTDGASWRLAHLPAPTPFLTHVAALPWLRTALLSDGLFKRAPDRVWHTLVRYEVAGSPSYGVDRAIRWAVVIPCSVIVFVLAGAAGAQDPKKLVAATVLAVFFTACATWFANRESAMNLVLDRDGPSMQELAQSLRSLPPHQAQVFPRTSHRPLGSALYDRLFALGHDPGPRPHT